MSLAVSMNSSIVRLFGWPVTLLYGDPCILDRWRWLRRHLQRGSLRTLDAGCGSGVFTLYAGTLGNEAIGLSFEKENNEKARTRAKALDLCNVHFMHTDLRKLDGIAAELGTFDQIICCEVIEHIVDDRKLLASLAAMLKPGGRIVLTTPSEKHRRLVGERISESEDGGHVRWGYSRRELRNLLENCGLRTVSEEEISGMMSQQLTNLCHLLGRIGSRYATLLTLPLRLLQLVDIPVTRLVRYPFLCIGIVCTKPLSVEGNSCLREDCGSRQRTDG